MQQAATHVPNDEVNDEHTVTSSMFDVGSGHKLWYELWGNVDTDKTPFIVFHGGPGADSIGKRHKEVFDPEHDLVLFFDQRGCGMSMSETPRQSNTTWDTIADAKLLADAVGFERVNVRGSSFGSTLCLLFAIKYPEFVQDVVISAVFLADAKSVQHFNDGTIGLFYPEVWQKLLSCTPADRHDNPIRYHLEQVQKYADADDFSSPELVRSIVAIHNYESNLEDLGHSFVYVDPDNPQEDFDPLGYAIFADYEINDSYLEEGYILRNIHKFNGHIYIVQGRFDMLCPMLLSTKLAAAANHATLTPVVASHNIVPESLKALRRIIQEV